MPQAFGNFGLMGVDRRRALSRRTDALRGAGRSAEVRRCPTIPEPIDARRVEDADIDDVTEVASSAMQGAISVFFWHVLRSCWRPFLSPGHPLASVWQPR